jgi:hypothetical protein
LMKPGINLVQLSPVFRWHELPPYDDCDRPLRVHKTVCTRESTSVDN